MNLLTGATGYIGGRLLRRLERNGSAVRCLCRNPEALAGACGPGTELVRGDLLEPASLGAAFQGVDTAFYLVHSMNSGEEFEAEERTAAANFAAGGASSGSAANCLPGRAGARRRPFSSHAQPGRDRRHPALERRSGDRISGVDRNRIGQRIV